MKNSENRCLCGVVKPGQQMSSFPMFVQWKPWWPLSHSFIQISRESTLLALICVHVCVCHSGTSKPISRIAANLKRISSAHMWGFCPFLCPHKRHGSSWPINKGWEENDVHFSWSERACTLLCLFMGVVCNAKGCVIWGFCHALCSP